MHVSYIKFFVLIRFPVVEVSLGKYGPKGRELHSWSEPKAVLMILNESKRTSTAFTFDSLLHYMVEIYDFIPLH